MTKGAAKPISLYVRRALAGISLAACVPVANGEGVDNTPLADLEPPSKFHLPIPIRSTLLVQNNEPELLILPTPEATSSNKNKDKPGSFRESMQNLFNVFRQMDFLDVLLPSHRDGGQPQGATPSSQHNCKGATCEHPRQNKNDQLQGVALTSTEDIDTIDIPDTLPWGQLISTDTQTQRIVVDVEKVCPISIDRRHIGLLPELLNFMGPVPVNRNPKPATSTERRKAAEAGQVFYVESGPPPGFEFLDEPQTTLVDAYYIRQRIGDVEATFTPSTIKISNPALIVDRLSNVKDKEKLIAALSGELPVNANLICPEKRPPICEEPNLVNGAAVVFDSSNYRLDVFASGELMEAGSRADPILPPPTAGKSFDNEFNLAIAGSTPGNDNTYNFQNDGFLANGGARINYATSLSGDVLSSGTNGGSNDDFSGSESNQHDFTITQLNATWDHSDRRQLRLGYIETTGDVFIGNQDLLGIGYGLTLDTLRRETRDAYGSPLLVFLNSPSQVQVFRDGRLLTSQQLPAGQQYIDTTSLPSGSYPVEIRIRDSLGNLSTENKFFVKSTEFAPKGYPLYYANVGFLTDNSTDTQTVLPEISSELLYQAGINKRIGENWGVLGSITGTPNNNYLDAGLFLLLPWYSIQLEPQILVGHNGDYGASIQGRAFFGDVSINLNATQLFADDNNEDNTNTNDFTFDPFIQGRSNVTFSMSFPVDWYKTSVTVNAQWNKNETDDDPNYVYGFRSRSILKRWKKSYLQLDLSAARSETDPLFALAGLTWNYSGEKFQHNFTTGYDHSEEEASQNGLAFDLQSTYRDYDAAQEGLEITVGARHDTEQQNVRLGIDELNRLIHANAQATHNIPKEGDANTQYSGYASSRLVWAEGGKPAFGAGQGQRAGIVAHIESDQPGQEFQVLNDNGQVLRVIKTDQPTPVFLNDYDEYSISIKDTASDFFKYDERQTQVVLYPGNYQYIKWEARQKVILFTKVLLPNGEPLAIARAEETADFNYTDDFGFIQLEIFKDQREIKFEQAGSTLKCTVNLPTNLEIENNFASIDNVTCIPTQGSAHSPLQEKKDDGTGELIDEAEGVEPPKPKAATPAVQAPPRDEAKLPTPNLTPEFAPGE
jgi:outer membrane usher protein FimD/PapC